MTIFETLCSLARSPGPAEKRYHLLDIARALAAIVILLWHYQHFIVEGQAGAGTRGAYPIYFLLWPFYDGGGVAVQFFWIISGFVFASVYCNRKTSGKSFFFNRLARLYPLHFITLIVIAVLQIVSIILLEKTLMNEKIDTYHFIVNLLFVSGWISGGSSFNGPIWSVSLEIGIYAIFWALLPYLFKFGIVFPLIISVVFLVTFFVSPDILFFSCGFDFFAGCSIYVVSRRVEKDILIILASLLVVTGAVIWHYMHAQGIATIIVFNGVIMLIACAEDFPRVSSNASKIRWFGDCTYGLYLWHVPLQMVVLLIIYRIDITRDIFYSPLALLAYLASMLCISRMSYLFIESPWRRRIQQWGR